MNPKDLNFKIPKECKDYPECSKFVTTSIEEILEKVINGKRNIIKIFTNLRQGLPMENINKIAGPFVEAWAYEVFEDEVEDKNNKYKLINVEAQERLNKADIILQFEKKRKIEIGITAEVDVKSTSEDFKNSGKSPNITSFARIRSAYIEDPDYLFIILSLKYRVYSTHNKETKMMEGIMEVVAHNAYDLKYVSSSDINYNPALGTGQLQIRDIHYVSTETRTSWQFCQLLDKKFLASSRRNINEWLALAKSHGWIKIDE